MRTSAVEVFDLVRDYGALTLTEIKQTFEDDPPSSSEIRHHLGVLLALDLVWVIGRRMSAYFMVNNGRKGRPSVEFRRREAGEGFVFDPAIGYDEAVRRIDLLSRRAVGLYESKPAG